MVNITFDEYVNMMEDESKWQIIKDFVNETKYFRSRDIPLGSTGKVYVNYLHKAGFLGRPKKGIYSLNLHVENDITLYKVTDYAYGDNKGVINKVVRKNKIINLNEISEE